MCVHSFHWLNSQEAERGECRQGRIVRAQGPPFTGTLPLDVSTYKTSTDFPIVPSPGDQMFKYTSLWRIFHNQTVTDCKVSEGRVPLLLSLKKDFYQ